jgi:hypothetical protein
MAPSPTRTRFLLHNGRNSCSSAPESMTLTWKLYNDVDCTSKPPQSLT